MEETHHNAYQSASSPVLISTTDVRTPTVTEILCSLSAYSEICFYVRETREQLRITARTYVIPAPTHALYAQFDWKASPYLRAFKKEDKMDWEPLRGDLLRPTPGIALGGGYEQCKKWEETLPRWQEIQDDE
ncbi:hypothetical protein GLOTRDRAFT_89680 [Gloeophyllum trabeum ATCC 11539]|uniref:Pyridoxamine 5'-phosphate oxidase Alr4036 family FMN-binding domain-containing protein n=1 Tax=Gloeophyllum trabeum (strain ATCC 11539 / FP-39264 / Madison 617) TaxID=670483 RepID=S7QK07_GLOTA|nr:uncharacterized protein GLOTRDRAFT_89680 [Gloeophyllum trabeum ATCC 11539]EPQ60056.1 hypothetical protein GLOTRDRAFT_89680 [Gloeophyllum trabeum ATCC 11539]